MKKISKSLYWTPRIITIFFILFLAMFSLDVFDSCNYLWECILGLLIHNVPVFILIIILAISWKYEIVGAIAFAIMGVAYIILLALNPEFEWYMISWAITIAGPLFLIGYLFLKNWKKRK
jgi:hypothetical protein